MVYCVNIIRLNHFTIEICVFTDAFLLCIFDHALECDIY